MGFGCPICSEKLDKLPAEAQRGAQRQQTEVNISATPCGHLFHSYCIQKWLTGNLQSSKQCPCCRKEVPKLRCLSLFPTSYDESILDDSLSQSGDAGPAYQPCNHGELITSLKNQVARLTNEVTEKGQLYDLLTGDYDTLLERFRQEKMTSDTWMMKSKQYESYKDLAEEMQARARNAEEKLKTFQMLDSILKGAETKVNEEIVNFPPSVESVRSLLETRHVVTAELRGATKKYNDLKKNYELIRKEKVVLKGQFDKKVRELKELKHAYDMGFGGATQHSTGGPSPMRSGQNGLLDQSTTPTAFRSKRRFQDAVPSTSGTALFQSLRPNFKNASGVDVDSDVDVYQPTASFKSKKKVKSSATTTTTSATAIGPPSSKKSKVLQDPPRPGPEFKVKAQTTVTSTATTAQPKKKVPKFTCGLSPIVPEDKTKKTAEKTIDLCTDSSSDELLDLDEEEISRIPESDTEDYQDSQEDFIRIKGNPVGAPLAMPPSRMKHLQEKSNSPVLGLSRGTKPTKKFTFNKKH